jgi:hypothetical protein
MGVLDWFRAGRVRAVRRVDEWHREWLEATAAPDGSRIVELEQRLTALQLPEEDIEIEREMLAGLGELVTLRDTSSNGTLPTIETGHRIVGADICHFSVPSSRPDDPAQPSGRLILTNRRAIFAGGPQALTLPWHAVTQVMSADRDIVLIRADRETLYRFRCNSYGEALRGTFIARQLSNGRRPKPAL